AFLVHEGRVKSTDPSLELSWFSLECRGLESGRFCCSFHQIVEPPFCAVRHRKSEAVAGLVFRDRRFVEPRPVGVTKEVVARFDVRINACRVEAPASVLRARKRVGKSECRAGKCADDKGDASRTNGRPVHFHSPTCCNKKLDVECALTAARTRPS